MLLLAWSLPCSHVVGYAPPAAYPRLPLSSFGIASARFYCAAENPRCDGQLSTTCSMSACEQQYASPQIVSLQDAHTRSPLLGTVSSYVTYPQHPI